MLKKNRLVTIEIMAGKLKIVEMTSKGKKGKHSIIIHDYIEKELPEGFFRNGKILNLEELGDIIKETIDITGIKTKKVIFTLDSTLIVSRDLVMPVAKENEIENMIRFEIEQYLPINLDDYVIQHKILEGITVQNEKKMKVNVAAMPKSLVEEYLALANYIELEPIALDTNSNAISKLVKKIEGIDSTKFEGTYSIIDDKLDSMGIYIFNGKLLKMTRFVLGDFGKMDQYEILDSIRGVFDMYLNMSHGDVVERAYFYGDESNFKFIESEASREVYFCREIDKHMKVESRATEFEAFKYMNCIGAGVRLD